MTGSRSLRRRSQAVAVVSSLASSSSSSSSSASSSADLASSTNPQQSLPAPHTPARRSTIAEPPAVNMAGVPVATSHISSHHEPDQDMSSAIKGGHSLRRRKTLDYGENSTSTIGQGSSAHGDPVDRDIGYRTRTQTGAVAKTRKRIVDNESGDDDAPIAKRRNGPSLPSASSAVITATASATVSSSTPRKNPARASRRLLRPSRLVDSDVEDDNDTETATTSRTTRLRSNANGRVTRKAKQTSSALAQNAAHAVDSQDEISAASDGIHEDEPHEQASDTQLSESSMPHYLPTADPKLPVNSHRFPSMLPRYSSTGEPMGSPREQARMYRDATEYHRQPPELDVVRTLPDGQHEVYRTSNYRLGYGERVYQAVNDPLRNINGSIKSRYSKLLSSPHMCEVSQSEETPEKTETRKSTRQKSGRSKLAKGKHPAASSTAIDTSIAAPGSVHQSQSRPSSTSLENLPQPLSVVDSFWKAHRLTQTDADQRQRGTSVSASALEKRTRTSSSANSLVFSMSPSVIRSPSSKSTAAAPHETWDAYLDDEWTLQPESRVPEVEEKDEDEDGENDVDGAEEDGAADEDDVAVESGASHHPPTSSQQASSHQATVASRVASSDEAEEANDSRFFLFRKLPDINDIVSVLQNHDDMEYDDLVHCIDSVNQILYQYQNEFVATSAVVDDWENAQRRSTDDANSEKLLVPKEFLLKGYSAKSMTAKERDIYTVRMMDRLMADLYFFRYDPHVSKIGRQDPLDQPHEAAPNHGDVRRSLRNDPNKTTKGTDHSDPNIITGKRMRKPREMFDGQSHSRSATPSLQLGSKRSTRGRRGEEEALDITTGDNSASASFNSNASFSGVATTSGLSETQPQSSTPSTPAPASIAVSISTPTKNNKMESASNPRKRRRIKNEEPTHAVEDAVSDQDVHTKEGESVAESQLNPEQPEEEEPPRKRRVRRTKAQIAADKAAAEGAVIEEEINVTAGAPTIIPPSVATSDIEAEEEPAKKRIVNLMVPNLRDVRGSATTSKNVPPPTNSKKARKEKENGKDASTPALNGSSNRRKATNSAQPCPPSFSPNDSISGPASGPVVFPGVQAPPNHNGQIMWNSNPDKLLKRDSGSGRSRSRGSRRNTAGATHPVQPSSLPQPPQLMQSHGDSSHVQHSTQLPPHSQSQVPPPPHIMQMQSQPMYDNKQPPLSHMPTIIAHYPPIQHQLSPHTMTQHSENGQASSHPPTHHHGHNQNPPYGSTHIPYTPKTQFIQHSHQIPPQQHSHPQIHGHSHGHGHNHTHAHIHDHGHGHNHGHGGQVMPPPSVPPSTSPGINNASGAETDNRVRIKMVKPNQKPINLDNVVMGSKEYAQMTKSEKMSHSMKNRWKSGSMQGAVDKRKATLARKKQDRDPLPANNNHSRMGSNGSVPSPIDHGPTGASIQSTRPVTYANPSSVPPLPLYAHHSQTQHMHSHSQIPPPPQQQRSQHPHGVFLTQPPPQSGYSQQGQQKSHVGLPPPPMGQQPHQQSHPSQQQEPMAPLNISRYVPPQP
ncbi:uncharacterized protein BROUX77_008154 [Berkeleyomyces rouxiae]|uniref:uncharacterized protein n=1 Tax=Berkeleyomyces rouxiae TaxID=2035830 RepID=UPI003B7D2B8F